SLKASVTEHLGEGPAVTTTEAAAGSIKLSKGDLTGGWLERELERERDERKLTERNPYIPAEFANLF
ncbi:hypothetical protein, partial [Klebsiella pneumoniae]|uniref:hypothetical protein n=1 Tax=Klebsiella pneumoniae TaxID=573 RepID=UPI001D0D42C1